MEKTFIKTLEKAKDYNFVRVISREGSEINKMFKEINWNTDNEEFKNQVILETEKIALMYPSYLKPLTQESNFSENAIRILKLQAEGYSILKIAEELGLKVENIKYHNKQNFKKLGVNSKTAAVMEARKRQLI